MQMPEKKKIDAIQHRTINGEIRAVEKDSKSYELSFSSEVPVSRWYGQEILSHDKEAVDLQRIKDVGTVLFSHGRDVNYGRMPVAGIDDVWLDEVDRKLRAKITFDDDENSEKLRQKVEKGLIKGVSFGYSVSSWEEVTAGKKSVNGRFIGPAYIGIRWEPFEISLEPTPADPSVGVGREIDIDGNKQHVIYVKKENPEEAANEILRIIKTEKQEEKPQSKDDGWFFNLRKKINS